MCTTDERGMTTAEYSIGTIGAVMIASILMTLGDPDGWFFRHLADIFQQALEPRSLVDLFERSLPFL